MPDTGTAPASSRVNRSVAFPTDLGLGVAGSLR
jgi:hypothetical protein